MGMDLEKKIMSLMRPKVEHILFFLQWGYIFVYVISVKGTHLGLERGPIGTSLSMLIVSPPTPFSYYTILNFLYS